MSDRVSVDTIFPNPWLRPEDLGSAADVVVADWADVSVWSRRDKEKVRKTAISFAYKGRVLVKRLILNVTQAESFATVCGSRFLDDWTGTLVRLSVGVASNGKATIVVNRGVSPSSAPPPNAQVVASEAADRAEVAADLKRGAGGDADLAAIAAGKEARDAAEAHASVAEESVKLAEDFLSGSA